MHIYGYLGHICTCSERMSHSRGLITWGCTEDEHRGKSSVYAECAGDSMQLRKAHETHSAETSSLAHVACTCERTETIEVLCFGGQLYTAPAGLRTHFASVYTCLHVCQSKLTSTCTQSQVQRLVVGLWACLRGWSMVFYCFPRIIGRVHQEGKAIHQNAAKRKRESEREWERQSRAGTERKGWREGGSTIMEGKIGEDRGKGVGIREREGDLGEKRMQDGDGGGKGRR